MEVGGVGQRTRESEPSLFQSTHTYARTQTCMHARTHTHTRAHSRPKQTDCDHTTTSTHRLLLALFMLAFISCHAEVYDENRE